MSAYDLSAGGIGIGVEIHPVGSIAQSLCRRCHGYGYAVVTEAHADVAHYDALVGVEGYLSFALVDAYVINS